jgi:hypothetical protein
MEQNPLIVVEDTFKLKRGQIIETYKKVSGGAITKDGDFLSTKNYIVLTEALSKDDEKKIRDMIRQQLRLMFWNLYTKNGILIGNL